MSFGRPDDNEHDYDGHFIPRDGGWVPINSPAGQDPGNPDQSAVLSFNQANPTGGFGEPLDEPWRFGATQPDFTAQSMSMATGANDYGSGTDFSPSAPEASGINAGDADTADSGGNLPGLGSLFGHLMTGVNLAVSGLSVLGQMQGRPLPAPSPGLSGLMDMSPPASAPLSQQFPQVFASGPESSPASYADTPEPLPITAYRDPFRGTPLTYHNALEIAVSPVPAADPLDITNHPYYPKFPGDTWAMNNASGDIRPALRNAYAKRELARAGLRFGAYHAGEGLGAW